MRAEPQASDVVGAVAGVLFAIALFLSVAWVDPLRSATDAELADWWASGSNRDALFISSAFRVLAAVALLVFVAALRSRLSRFDPEDLWRDLMFGAGVIATAAVAASGVVRGLVVQAIRFQDDPVPGVDTLRFATELQNATYGHLAIPFATIVVLATSVLALRTGVLARWIGWLGLAVSAIALVTVALLVGAFATPLILLWTLATSGYLVVAIRRTAPLAVS